MCVTIWLYFWNYRERKGSRQDNLPDLRVNFWLAKFMQAVYFIIFLSATVTLIIDSAWRKVLFARSISIRIIVSRELSRKPEIRANGEDAHPRLVASLRVLTRIGISTRFRHPGRGTLVVLAKKEVSLSLSLFPSHASIHPCVLNLSLPFLRFSFLSHYLDYYG